MSAYYHTEIPDHSNLQHTLILMNHPSIGPNCVSFPDSHPPPSQPPAQPPQSHNILLLNSAAATLSHPQLGRFFPGPQPQQDTITLYGYPAQQPPEAREPGPPRRALSLSLSSENGPHADVAVGAGGGGVLGSKFLRAAQELLEEVVHVGEVVSNKGDNNNDESSPKKGKREPAASEERENRPQLSAVERQEVQMKKAKLATMLDEAEQRYRQYHHQMQIVISSFEHSAGVGSAKTYTALALKTISKQFRCLKDAIQAQIRLASRSLGEEEGGSGSPGGKIEGSRLKYIDHQIRQQRALQQLGMIPNHNAWRPQRGLPEKAVSILRAWLFEHFLHPYPKDSDKILLAKQTGLTRSQVSNWFINARVRLWKPMIEEMYNEEVKEQELNNAISEDQKTSSKGNSSNNEDQDANLNSPVDQEKGSNVSEDQAKSFRDRNNVSSSTSFMSFQNQHHIATLETEGLSQGSPKRQRSDEFLPRCEGSNDRDNLIKFGDEKQERENGYLFMSGGNGMNFVSYPIGDISRFGAAEEFSPPPRFLPGNGNGNGNGISLSLGLPPSENHPHHQQLNLSATNLHTFLSPNQSIQFGRAGDFGSMTGNSQTSAAAFECIDIQNRKGFAAQLLPDWEEVS